MVPASHSSSDRLSTYHDYVVERMVRAFEATQQGELSIRRAAEEHGVPRTTLLDKVVGRYAVNARSGRPLLTANDEKSLADFLIGCASVGYAKSRKDVLSIVQRNFASVTAMTLLISPFASTMEALSNDSKNSFSVAYGKMPLLHGQSHMYYLY